MIEAENSGVNGPYKPTWTNRRRVTFGWLGQTVIALHLDWYGIYDISEAVQHSILVVAGILLTWYLIGPSWEGVKTFIAWRK
jgi:hypothetical protein